ncbi:MAG: diaminopimelate decarboxylase [Candidatus Omnitrophica bacterium CG_4_9_14_0_2_um_filter_42_8]|nr:MAG: diaminopimelate decarboxylase [Candidatus Omnitrophica bacterium CG22_combo_CG10-13_8_21_14_all_43_16]PJC48396.1 MAG: diaminopimelate decarboxylase [Candidatus Omnitrophica bacterium CG_4_9_14_0_2_um_filter_42_8]
MHDFNYKHNNLYCEAVSIEKLAEKYGTPLYVYSRNTLISHYRKIKEAFGSISPLICYSMKANSNLSICKALVKEGAGLDIVSGGELYRALKAGVSPKKIVYAGVGKTEKEIETAIKRRISFFNVESIPELRLINKVAGTLGTQQKVAIRINPDVKAKTHKYITTGHGENKFGIDFETAGKIFLERARYKNLNISGIHMHIGSQIVDSEPFIKAMKRVVGFIKYLETHGAEIRWLNIGGGLGIIYSKERPQTAKEYASAILPILKKIKANIIMEPGRFIVGNAGVMVTRVQYIKETPSKNFAIVDAGMNDLIRPSLYGAYHEILPVRSHSYLNSKDVRVFDVVGPICESGDFLGKDRKFVGLKEGDLLSVMGIGAYGSSMASNYNSRLRASGVMVDGSKVKLIRRRETYEDLIRAEL